ncbi:MAG: LemA family protein [Rhizobiales bacterium]|nr:LemA family protein [Hyphomicrobiales bacterium]NRB15173.1 LemA family protein [Hyphomicrobiales bacterium]
MMKQIKIILLVLMAMTVSSCGINSIPTFEEAAKAQWSQVLNQYQRRTDLIPNLVETVKAYAAHEQETLTAVVEARAKATQLTIPKDILTNPAAFSAFQANQDGLGAALGKLMVVVERYPDLKADKNFLTLQSQLEGTENRIAVARRDYIIAVQEFNTEIKTFPGRLWHSLMYSDSEYMQQFEITAAAETAPSVSF